LANIIKCHSVNNHKFHQPQDVMDEAVMAQIQEAMLAAQQQQEQQQQQQGGPGQQQQQRVSEAELQGANPLMMLLRSLLPWVDAGQAPEYGADDEGGGGGGQRQGGGGGGGAPQ
jgi:hypothetical protein